MGAVRLVEFIKDMLLGVLGNARTIVVNGKDNPISFFPQADPYNAALGIEFDGVADQVVPDMVQQAFISLILHAVQLHIKFHILFRPGRLQSHNGLPDLLVQAESGLLGLDGLILNFGQQQDVSHKRRQPLGIEQDLLHIPLLILVQIIPTLQQGRIPLDGVDWGLELMGHVGHKIRLQNLRGGQLMDHQIEAGIDLFDLLGAAFCLQPDGEVPVCHRFHGGAQLFDGAEKPPGQKACHKNAHQYADCHQVDQQQHLRIKVDKPFQQQRQSKSDENAEHQFHRHHQRQPHPKTQLVLLVADGFECFSGFHSLTTL